MKLNNKIFFFRNILSNMAICLVLLTICLIAVSNTSTSLTSTSNYSAFYNGNKQKNNIALMFNVYQGSEYVEQILKILESENVTATFFVGGIWIAKNLEMGTKILANNHEMGNHGYYHKDHDKISEQRNKDEISITHNLVQKNLDYQMTLFAPPSGAYNDTTLKVANSLNYKTIMWSKDTIDWRDKNTQLITSRATKNLQNGDFILMHPTYNTVFALPEIISIIKAQNFNLTSVSKCLE